MKKHVNAYLATSAVYKIIVAEFEMSSCDFSN